MSPTGQLIAARSLANTLSEINAHSTTAHTELLGSSATFEAMRSELSKLVEYWNHLLT